MTFEEVLLTIMYYFHDKFQNIIFTAYRTTSVIAYQAHINNFHSCTAHLDTIKSLSLSDRCTVRL